MLALSVFACAAAQLRSSSTALGRLRTLYPLACGPLLFAAAGPQSPALHGHLLDRTMLGWEERLFGGHHPNLMLDSVASRPLDEALSLSYSSYYLYFVLPPAYLAAKGMSHVLRRYVLALCLATYLCCLGFVTLPLAGPLTTLDTAFTPRHLHGYVAQPVQAWLIDTADPPGTCFPSAHVAGAWAATLTMRAADLPGRPVRAMTAVTVLLTVSVVYCRYHYLLDAVAGLAVAGLVLPVTTWLSRREGRFRDSV